MLSRAACPAPRAQPAHQRAAGSNPGGFAPAAPGPAGQQQRQHRTARLVPNAKPGETPEQALERRMRESAQVEERVTYITNEREWEEEMSKVGAAAAACCAAAAGCAAATACYAPSPRFSAVCRPCPPLSP